MQQQQQQHAWMQITNNKNQHILSVVKMHLRQNHFVHHLRSSLLNIIKKFYLRFLIHKYNSCNHTGLDLMKLTLTPLLWGEKMSFGPKTIGLNFNISCLNEMVSNNYQALKKTKSFRGILNKF